MWRVLKLPREVRSSVSVPHRRILTGSEYFSHSVNNLIPQEGDSLLRVFYVNVFNPKENVVYYSSKPMKAYKKRKDFTRADSLSQARTRELQFRDNSLFNSIGRDQRIVLPASVTPKRLASLMGIGTVDVLKMMIKLGEEPRSSVEVIQSGVAEYIASELKFQVAKESDIEGKDILPRELPKDRSRLPVRPPVVTVMGHVNHGKTTLLDALRNSKMAEAEIGGITQRTSAFNVSLPSGEKMAILDTPGHAAFSSMRIRGARITDIVIVVIAADDGVNEQTKEVLKHVKKTGAAVVVAINKCDKNSADPKKVKQQLLEEDIIVEDFGGDVQCVEISALKRENLDELVETVLFQAGLLDLREDTSGNAEAAVIETRQEKGFGTVATVLVRFGTLLPGSIVVSGRKCARFRFIHSDGKRVSSAKPSQVADITGLTEPLDPGELLHVVDTEEEGRDVILFRTRKMETLKQLEEAEKQLELQRLERAKIRTRIESGEVEEEEEGEEEEVKRKVLPVVIKGDTLGAIEAVISSLEAFPSGDEVAAQCVGSSVGAVTEGDIQMAQTTGGILIVYGSKMSSAMQEAAERSGVTVLRSSIIYDILDKVEEKLEGMLELAEEEVTIGTAEVLQTFPFSGRTVAGSRVTTGKITMGSHLEVFRAGELVYKGKVSSLRHLKDEVKEIKAGQECGLGIDNWSDVQTGDILKALQMQLVPRKLGQPKRNQK